MSTVVHRYNTLLCTFLCLSFLDDLLYTHLHFGVSHLSLFLYESRLTNCFLFDLYFLEDFLVHSIEPDLILKLYQSIQPSLSSFHTSRAAVEK